MTKKSDVTKYYDDFIQEQYKIGVNDRILWLYEQLLQQGLTSKSDVIELGCGIGVVTHLIRKTVQQGQIESVDLSPESITFAQSKITNANVKFAAADVVEYQPSISGDFVTLFDVIEHIPIELHEALFKNVAGMLKQNGLLLINIPSPASIEWDRIHAPEVLQIIDQPIPLSLISKNCENAGLEITFFQSHSIWKKDDYHFMVIRKKQEYSNQDIELSLVEKAKRKVKRSKMSGKFKY